MHVDNKNKVFLILGEEPTQGLDYTLLTAEVKYPINIQPNKTFLLSLNYNESSSLFFVNASKIYQLKAKKLWNKRLYTVFSNTKRFYN